MQNKNWKYIGITLIGVTGILVFLLLSTSQKLSKFRMDNQAQNEKIAHLKTELDNTIQTLEDFYFNAFEIRATTINNVIAIGDTLEVEIGIFAMNYIWDDDTDKTIEPIILLAAGIDNDRKMLGPFDTIPAYAWEGRLKIIATELGTHEINGTYQFPDIYNFQGTYPFSMKYTVTEKNIR